MSLRTKTVLVTVLMTAGMMVAMYLAAQIVLETGFAQVEREAVERSVTTLEGHMPFEVAVVAEKLTAFGPLDDVATVAANPERTDGPMITSEHVRGADLDVALVFTSDGELVRSAADATLDLDANAVATAWREARSTSAEPRGLLRIGRDTAIVASSTLTLADGGAPVGSILVGRVIDAALVEQIEELTHLDLEFRPYDAPDLPDAFEEARQVLADDADRPIEAIDANTIAGFTALDDVAGRPATLVRVATSRPIAAQARDSRTTLLVSMAGVGLALVLLVVPLVQRGVLNRFLRMSGTIRRIADEGDAGLRLPVRGRDELAQLGSDVNQMLASLQASQAALRESEARYALVADGANDGIWDWDLRSDEVTYTARFLAMLGLPAEERRAGMDLWQGRVHPDDRPRFDAELERVRTGQAAVLEDEHRVRLEDGTWLWMLARGAATHEHGRPVRLAGSLTDITERGVFDPATGLPNRVLLNGRLDQIVERTQRAGTADVAVVALGLEGLKRASDGLGPRAAERLVDEAARRLSAAMRGGDLLARTDSDTFVAVLEDVGEVEEILGTVSRMAERTDAAFEVDETSVHLALTAGVVSDPSPYLQADDLLADAILARDQARADGRRVAWFDAEMQERVVARQRTESELRTAIGEGGLALRYQPIVDLASQRLHGFEALVRWQHPTRGLLSPAAFVDLAEETGLIVPLGAWVLREAASAATHLGRAVGNLTGPVVHVNLSAKQLFEPDLVGTVQRALETAGLDPAGLELEVTESAMMADPEVATDVLGRLRALGVRLAVDDFGTGYSSLAYLHDLPVHTLKIDRSFVFRMLEDERSHKIVRSIVHLGTSLGLRVVAEGIETAEHLRELTATGVPLGQGYLFARPMPLADAAAWRLPVAPASEA